MAMVMTKRRTRKRQHHRQDLESILHDCQKLLGAEHAVGGRGLSVIGDASGLRRRLEPSLPFPCSCSLLFFRFNSSIVAFFLQLFTLRPRPLFLVHLICSPFYVL